MKIIPIIAQLILGLIFFSANGQQSDTILSNYRYSCNEDSKLSSSYPLFPSQLILGSSYITIDIAFEITNICSRPEAHVNLFMLTNLQRITPEAFSSEVKILNLFLENEGSNIPYKLKVKSLGIDSLLLNSTSAILSPRSSFEVLAAIDLQQNKFNFFMEGSVISGYSQVSSVNYGRNWKFDSTTKFYICSDDFGRTIISCFVKNFQVWYNFPFNDEKFSGYSAGLSYFLMREHTTGIEDEKTTIESSGNILSISGTLYTTIHINKKGMPIKNSRTRKEDDPINRMLAANEQIENIKPVSKVVQYITIGLAQVVNFISSGSRMGVSTGLTNLAFNRIKYLNVTFSIDLAEALLTWDKSFVFLGFKIKIPNDLVKSLPYRTIPLVFERLDIVNSFLLNFWQQVLILGMVIVAYIIVWWCEWITVDTKMKYKFLFRLLRINCQNFLFTQFFMCCGDIIIFSTLEYRSLDLGEGLTWLSFTISIILICFLLIIFAFNYWILSKYRKLKAFEEETNNFELLDKFINDQQGNQIFFKDFKDQSIEHQLFLPLLIAREILFSMLFALLFDYSVTQIILFFLFNAVIIIYILAKRPLINLLDQVQQYFHEIITIIINVCTYILAILGNEVTSDENIRNKMGIFLMVLNLTFHFGSIILLSLRILTALRDTFIFWKEYLSESTRQIYPISHHPPKEEYPSVGHQEFRRSEIEPSDYDLTRRNLMGETHSQIQNTQFEPEQLAVENVEDNTLQIQNFEAEHEQSANLPPNDEGLEPKEPSLVEQEKSNQEDQAHKIDENNENNENNEMNQNEEESVNNELDESSEENKNNDNLGMQELNESKKITEVNDVQEINEINGVNEINEKSGMDEIQERNEVDGINENNEVVEPSEIKEINEIDESNNILRESENEQELEKSEDRYQIQSDKRDHNEILPTNRTSEREESSSTIIHFPFEESNPSVLDSQANKTVSDKFMKYLTNFKKITHADTNRSKHVKFSYDKPENESALQNIKSNLISVPRKEDKRFPSNLVLTHKEKQVLNRIEKSKKLTDFPQKTHKNN